MKRSEMLIHMQRAYGIRHVMVETGHLTIKEFMDELLTHMENKGMIPPERLEMIPEKRYPVFNPFSLPREIVTGGYEHPVRTWEPEDEKK